VKTARASKQYLLELLRELCFVLKNYPVGLRRNTSLDQHDETLFSLGEREALASYFSWDVAVKGDKNEVQTRASEVRRAPPRQKRPDQHA